jgi:microcystin-dependent protein
MSITTVPDSMLSIPSPAGSVMMYAGSSAPTGYLLCDGSAVSRTTYSALFTVIGSTYGSGDGSTTFNLPNTQGVFVRGAGSQTISSIVHTGTRGTTENDQFQGHFHSISNTYSLVTSGAGAGSNAQAGNSGSVVINPQTIGSPTSDGSNGTPRNGLETRPANISMNYIIKF